MKDSISDSRCTKSASVGDITRPTFSVTPYRTEKKPGGIDPDQPVGSCPAYCRIIEFIVITAGTEMVKTLTDRRILHTGNPKAFHRLITSGIFIDQTEDQFSFTPGIRSAYHRINVCPSSAGTKGQAAFSYPLELHISSFPVGSEGPHTAIWRTVLCKLRLCQFQKMSHAPAHQITGTFEITVFSFRCA